MKLRKLIPIVMILPLLAGCGNKEEENKKPEKPDLVIPTVDVEKITPTLPAKPSYSDEIKSDENYDYIDIYELSDFHGAVNLDGDKIGLSLLSGYLNKKRSENPGGTVVVSSGDMFQGSAESNLTRGYMVNYAMNYMGFDSMAIGNHEFDWTDAWLKKNANLSYNEDKIPFISANILCRENDKTPDFISKSTIVERGGYKIGIVGSIGENLKDTILASCVENYYFSDEASAVNDEAYRLKNEEDCDIVLLTAHNDIDLLSSKGFENIDAVFGGHSHVSKTLTMTGDIPAVQTENYGKAIAHIQLKIDKTSKEVSTSINELDENPGSLSGLVPDDNINKIMKNYESGINNIKTIKLGTCDSDLRSDGALKGICTEGMYQGALTGIKNLNLNISESDILATFHNVNGGIRSDIKKGEITYGDVYSPFPFDNEIVLYKVKGSKFKLNAAKYSSFACRRTFEKREEIDSYKDYYLVLTDFIALSANYFQSIFDIQESDLIRTGKVVRDEVANVIYKTDNIVGNNYKNVAPYKNIPTIF